MSKNGKNRRLGAAEVLSIATGVVPLALLWSLVLQPMIGYAQAPEVPRPLQPASGAVAPEQAPAAEGIDTDIYAGGGGTASEMVHVPVSNLYPGTVPPRPTVENPVAQDPDAANRGARYYNQFNCVGCHAPYGAGGMGPALSNHKFTYGGEPENIYLSILQGRPNGMPAWGGMLPDDVIWDLVAYIKSISNAPKGQWGKTTSLDAFAQEQVPAEYLDTVDPWEHLQPFSYGQPPFEKVEEWLKGKTEAGKGAPGQ